MLLCADYAAAFAALAFSEKALTTAAKPRAGSAIVRTILLRAHLRAYASGRPMTYEAIEDERAAISAAQIRLST